MNFVCTQVYDYLIKKKIWKRLQKNVKLKWQEFKLKQTRKGIKQEFKLKDKKDEKIQYYCRRKFRR